MFDDRKQAGILLAEKLTALPIKGALVIGLARGGVAVAKEIAKRLGLSLDVIVVKKIGSPHNQELAIGAIAPDNVTVLDWRMAHRTGADEHYVRSLTSRLKNEIHDKMLFYRKGKRPLSVRDKTVILADDGVATGATFEAAIQWLRKKKAKRIIAALPVAPRDVVSDIQPETDNLVILETPDDFSAVGQYYRDFQQTEDSDVIHLLQ